MRRLLLFAILATCSCRREPEVKTYRVEPIDIDINITVKADTEPRVFQCDPSALVEAKRRWEGNDPKVVKVVAKVREEADAAMGEGPFVVTDKKHPAPSGDVHDYVSLAPYFWPNPGTADGLPYVRRDGRRNPEAREYDVARLTGMSESVYKLALAYYLIGDERYARRAALLLRVWFLDPATRMNPNLNHGQFVRGRSTGRCYGIIETRRFFNVIDGVGMLAGSKAWSAEDQKGMEDWFGEYLRWMSESKLGKEEAATLNNHGTWYDVQVATFMLFVGDEAGARKVLEAAKERRIAAQIEADGRQPQELARTKSLGYSTMNLTGMTHLAELGRRVGVDLWNYRGPEGESIRAAIGWLWPYAAGEKKWEHEEIVGVRGSAMYVALMRAARAYGEQRYAEMARELGSESEVDELRWGS